MLGIWIARGVLLAASVLVLADAIYKIAYVPTKDELRGAYYRRWP